MQTFLPYESFVRSARVLDRPRLGKQRVECLQLLGGMIRIAEGRPKGGWDNGPVIRMWLGHEQWLLLYGVKICDEWIRRGYKDTCRSKMLAMRQDLPGGRSQPRPPWLGSQSFHRSHQSNLVRKDPGFYGPVFPGVPPHLDYVWPVPRLNNKE